MSDDSPTITVRIDNHPYTLRPRELNAWQTATFEAETGLSVEGMIYSISGSDPAGRSLTMFARFAYLCALQSGQNPRSFQEVAERITYGSDIGEPTTTGLEDPDVDPVLPDEDDLEEARARAEERSELLESAGPEPEDPTSAADGSTVAAPSSSSSSGVIDGPVW